MRLRPVTSDEHEVYPPPWPVQLADGELRIYHRSSKAGG